MVAGGQMQIASCFVYNMMYCKPTSCIKFVSFCLCINDKMYCQSKIDNNRKLCKTISTISATLIPFLFILSLFGTKIVIFGGEIGILKSQNFYSKMSFKAQFHHFDGLYSYYRHK